MKHVALNVRLKDDVLKPVSLTPCRTCKHRTGPMTCEAFDVTIPMPILKGEFDHKLPYPNDNGIQYEAK